MKNILIRGKRGITLVALIVTLIVMLILVSVTVTSAINGGLFHYTKKAAESTNTAIAKDKEMANATANMTTQELIELFGEKLLTVTKYGDTDLNEKVESTDAILVMQHIKNIRELSEQGLVNADVNLDGIVNGTDALLIDGCALSIIDLPYTTPYLVGDADLNGYVDAVDALIVDRYAEGTGELNFFQKLNADANFDGEITYEDAQAIMNSVMSN